MSRSLLSPSSFNLSSFNPWSAVLSLAIYPDRIVWLRLSAGLRKRVEAKGALSCVIDAELPWRGPIAMLPQLLAAAEMKAGRVSIVLSNRLVRYALTPNPDSARNQQELELLARHVFQRTHGEAAAQWDIRLSDAAPGRSGLASAVDREFIKALQTTVANSGNRLVSIQPYLMAAFNQSGWNKSVTVFALAEPQRLCLLAQRDGGWVSVQQSHSTPEWLQVLPETLERMAISAALDQPKTLMILAPELIEPFKLPTLMSSKGWQLANTGLRWPIGLMPTQDHLFAGAMLAGY